MAVKIRRPDGLYECSVCGYVWETDNDLILDADGCLCCPECYALIEDDDDNFF